MNKVLVVGGGGREHAIAWKLAQSPKVSQVYVAPGNAGMEAIATCVHIDQLDFEKLVTFAKDEGISLTIPGPEAVLAAGIVDYFQKEGLAIFGPTKAATAIESSKSFSKDLMAKYDIPTGEYQTFSDYKKAVAYIKTLKPPYVLKADGLAEGKGVIIVQTLEEADMALVDMLQNNRFGEAGNTVVIEEFLVGEEFSYMAFVNGADVYPMAIAQDHKRAFDNDKGPNTGGMGVYSPVQQITESIKQIAMRDILEKAAKSMVLEGRPFTGILYGGLIATADGPKTIEFNARFGDPETEIVLPLLENDLYSVMMDVLSGNDPNLTWSKEHIIGVVLASKGYPNKYDKDIPIYGLEDLDNNTMVFHFATTCKDGVYATNGGRVLLVVRKADSLEEARRQVYREIENIKCDNLYNRTDIGSKL